ncbi:MAG: nucleotidyltransferase family protein [Casimicrobiaceae bacterium]
MHIVGVLLAAGSGSRFGGDKLRHPLAPERDAAAPPQASRVPMGVVTCRKLVDALSETIAVVRTTDVALDAMLRDAGARVIACADAGLGMGHSLACAIAATADADGWVVALGDMPWVRQATIRALADALRGGASIAAPWHRGQRGNPVAFAAAHGPALIALRGDRGARDLLAAHAAVIRRVDVDDAGVLRDVDVGADL